jgi:UPF0716 protein FxsA
MPFAALVLLLPLAEVAVLVLVGSRVGVWPVLGWLVGAALAGGWLVRTGGRQTASGMQAALRGAADPAVIAAGGAMTILAGILLIVPGLLSDAAALALLLPPVRRFVAARLSAQGTNVGGWGVVWRGGPIGGGPDWARGGNADAATVIDGQYEVISGKAVADGSDDTGTTGAQGQGKAGTG